MGFELIQYNLNPKAVYYDIADFKKYEAGEINIQTLKYRWKVNNRVPYSDFKKITDEMFKDWVNSLGWKQSDE